MRDHLVERLPRVDPARIDAMLREERIVDRHGPIAPDAPFVASGPRSSLGAAARGRSDTFTHREQLSR
jgi:hypothetical protein